MPKVERIVNALATNRAGRVLLHLLTLSVDHEFRHHWAGIKRELKGE